ncbi:aminotransferase class III-fold pyridoxal phosphate-dependent enzyme [Streptomyces sp. MTZ3.1]|uniref:Diaminobutyrate--2-oxoglutarate transaminase n=1 Tax=Streptomyces meridianus TaxID=2938945 RepID=A0ABT0X8G2_9ACTN|nr:aminotransferase class III-fold pyridoxal phosphate-dependent enzyme [Streptomyces meridianus]MCM2578812.1 aminotransferase class III-fold pyridoxal phosphate-dependent enzyme [Streptomyces meridianus]
MVFSSSDATGGRKPRHRPAPESAARTHARSLPVVPVRARGMTIEDATGRRYLDCLSGGGTLALGHNHPVVLEAIRSVLHSGACSRTGGSAAAVRSRFVAELARLLPPGLDDAARIRICGPAEGDALAAAVRLVREATGRRTVAAFTGSREGETAPDSGEARPDLLPHPSDYRCPFGVGGRRGWELCLRRADHVLGRTGTEPPAAVLVEPVQGEHGGVVPAPDGWLRGLRTLTSERNIPLIADESQTGVGRTGALWAVGHSGIAPDVMILSGTIGGSLPLAVLAHREELACGRPGPGPDAHRGNQLAMAAGAATLSYVAGSGLCERAALLGERMLRRLRELALHHPFIGDVRGRGLMLGAELVAPVRPPRSDDAVVGRHPRPAVPAADTAVAVRRACLRRGLIVGIGGRDANVVCLLPPLTITDEQAESVLDRLSEAVAAVERAGDRSAV